ncbi:helix-turn-helix domain-containing protein [Leeia sp. TBRC 13508]|uniref:Helix-turn-helix domain-containing protein n=1 Tax=Leeia speluncae TaxID=2884804 RepID=A0ABS8D2D0_9NEIS|nr:helix-turn-helix domain-containing protein [Leeia speluncae]MCB6182363.1 helix-turn-helix domain-containing protein [Leeia speluncae]
MAVYSSGGQDSNASPIRIIRFGFILSPQFTLGAFSNFLDVIELARKQSLASSSTIRIEWDVISHDVQPIKSSAQLCLVPTTLIRQRIHYDYLVIVGGLLNESNKLPTVTNQFIQSAAANQTTLIGICTGTFILARLGLFTSARVCISWFHHQQFVSEFPQLRCSSDRLYHVEPGRITCAGGVGALHLAAYLIEQHFGKFSALQALRELQSDFPLPPNTLQPPPSLVTQVQNAKLKKAILHFEQRIRHPFSMDEVANELSLSTRHLERLFMRELKLSPTQFFIKLRLNHAYQLIKYSNHSISYIAFEAGFSDLPYFCRRFKEEFGFSASELRKNHHTLVAETTLQ